MPDASVQCNCMRVKSLTEMTDALVLTKSRLDLYDVRICYRAFQIPAKCSHNKKQKHNSNMSQILTLLRAITLP